MIIKNFTPHTISVQLSSEVVAFLPVKGEDGKPVPVRVNQTNSPLPHLEVGELDIPVSVPMYGGVTGLPEPEDGTVLVVSTMVADALRSSGRKDIYVPDSGPDAIRENGQIVAVRRLLYRGA